MSIQLDDLVYLYPSQDNPRIQYITTSKREFNVLSALPQEPLPGAGGLFVHQRLIRRLMFAYDRLLLIHKAGTGKTCSAFAAAEQFQISVLNATVDFVDTYLKTNKTHIRRVYYLVPNRTLVDEAIFQLVCRCTTGKYLTQKILGAQDERSRKSAIDEEIRKFYTIQTHETFARRLEGLSSEDLDREFSGSLFIIDEVHLLISRRVENTGERREVEQMRREARDRSFFYERFQTLFSSIKRSKIMLLTATPMIDNIREIIPLMNLILENENRMPSNLDLDNITLQQIEPYFRGRISFIREADINANLIFEGEPVVSQHTIRQINYPSSMIVYKTRMSDHQTESYRRTFVGFDENIIEESEELEELSTLSRPFKIDARETSIFVYPDGSYGSRGFMKYIINTEPDIYQGTSELLQQIRTEENLYRLSSKFSRIISLCKNSPGNCFIFTNFVTSSAAPLSICFQAQGFEQFTAKRSIFVSERDKPLGPRPVCPPSLLSESQPIERPTRPGFDKRPRFALLTSDTSVKRIETIKETFNSYENRHGEYLKVIIGTPAVQFGINLSNVIQIHLIDPWWNRSSIYQALNRAFRVTGFTALLEEERKKAIQEGRDPLQARINIRVFQHASYPNDNTPSVDEILYTTAERKDILIKRLERMIKQIAIDCWINYARNIRPSDINGSPECDYQRCEYICFDTRPTPNEYDYSSYNVLYSDEIVQDTAENIKTIFQITPTISISDLYQILSPEFQKMYIDLAIEKIISNRQLVTNRFGRQGFVLESGGILFIQEDFPNFTSPVNLAQSYYMERTFTLTHTRIENITSSTFIESEQTIVETLRNISPESEEFETLLDRLSFDTKVGLFEQAVLIRVQGQIQEPYQRSIEKRFQAHLYEIREPDRLIQQISELISQKAKGPGRRRKIESKRQIPRLPPDQPIPEPSPNSETVYISTLYTQRPQQTSYNIRVKFAKAEGRLRILKLSEEIGWHDITRLEEILAYNKIIQKLNNERIERITGGELYGMYYATSDKGFRIVDRTKEDREASARDAKRIRTGKRCTNWGKPDLVELFIKFQVPFNASNQDPQTLERTQRELETLTREQLLNRLRSEFEQRIESFTLNQLRQIYFWNLFTKDQLCDFLLQYLRREGRLIEI